MKGLHQNKPRMATGSVEAKEGLTGVGSGAIQPQGPIFVWSDVGSVTSEADSVNTWPIGKKQAQSQVRSATDTPLSPTFENRKLNAATLLDLVAAGEKIAMANPDLGQAQNEKNLLLQQRNDESIIFKSCEGLDHEHFEYIK